MSGLGVVGVAVDVEGVAVVVAAKEAARTGLPPRSRGDSGEDVVEACGLRGGMVTPVGSAWCGCFVGAGLVAAAAAAPAAAILVLDGDSGCLGVWRYGSPEYAGLGVLGGGMSLSLSLSLCGRVLWRWLDGGKVAFVLALREENEGSTRRAENL